MYNNFYISLFVEYLSNRETNLQTVFFFWKLRSIWKFWIQNHFYANLGGWDICKTKCGFETNKFIFLLTWSGSHSTRVVLRGPSWPLTDQISNLEILRCPKLAQSVIRVSWGPVVASQGQSGSIKTTLSQYEYELVYFGTPFCFVNISVP